MYLICLMCSEMWIISVCHKLIGYVLKIFHNVLKQNRYIKSILYYYLNDCFNNEQIDNLTWTFQEKIRVKDF